MKASAIILAAGKGTRMKSDLPKVLHPVCGRPMLAYVLDACQAAGCNPLVTVIGHQAHLVRQAFAAYDGPVRWVEQTEQLGTGHAVMVCQDELAKLSGPVLVLAGDGPLIRPETLRQILQTHEQEGAACTLATCLMQEPARYGRILRDEQGRLIGIVEYLDATDEQRALREVNVSMYCFDAAKLRSVLPRLSNENAKKEYYLTDALGILRADGEVLAAVAAVPEEEATSINTPEELAEVERMLLARRAAEGGGHVG